VRLPSERVDHSSNVLRKIVKEEILQRTHTGADTSGVDRHGAETASRERLPQLAVLFGARPGTPGEQHDGRPLSEGAHFDPRCGGLHVGDLKRTRVGWTRIGATPEAAPQEGSKLSPLHVAEDRRRIEPVN
jgi:hypothetical protein